jgi:hypothetical protein
MLGKWSNSLETSKIWNTPFQAIFFSIMHKQADLEEVNWQCHTFILHFQWTSTESIGRVFWDWSPFFPVMQITVFLNKRCMLQKQRNECVTCNDLPIKLRNCFFLTKR